MPVSELGGGLFRVTHPLPFGLDHVHCYALAGADGLTLVDTGLDDEATRESWRAALAELGGLPVARIVLTHFHPDHLGASAWLAEETGAAEVVQGALDARSAAAAWGSERDTAAYERYLAGHGMPPEHVERALAAQRRIPVAPAAPTRLVDEGDTLELAGETFRVLVLPGHADGHIALFGERSGRLIGGDVVLDPITPNIGRWHAAAADPLADYLVTLGRLGGSSVPRSSTRGTGGRSTTRAAERRRSPRTTGSGSTSTSGCSVHGRSRPTRCRSASGATATERTSDGSRSPRPSRT